MYTPSLILVLSLLQTIIAQHTSIDFQHFGNYADLRACAKNCLAEYCCSGNLAGLLGCATNDCLCGHQSEGQDILRTCVNSACTSDTGDLSSAISVYSAYCASYEAVATLNSTQTSTPSPAGTVTPTGNRVHGKCV